MKHKNKKIPEYKEELIKIFSKASGSQELLELFLKDILTPNEFETLALRWQIVKRLKKGQTQRGVVDELGLGMSTVTRGSRMLRNKTGGFNLLLEK